MAWRQLTIELGSRDPEPTESLLTELGALAVTLSDGGQQPLLEPAPGETPLWSSVRLLALFDEQADTSRIDAQLEPLDLGRRRWAHLEDREWERAWLDDFEPMRFGKSLWVLPHGHGELPPPGATVVRLDPGLAFGTGRHATTALCLEWLDAVDLRDRSVVDYGCGSGLLGIAAAKLGASRVWCLDIDEQALQATRANAQANHVADRVEVAQPAAEQSGGVDIVIANILADTLARLAPEFAHRLRAGGDIVLSGILDEQAGATHDVYTNWFDMDEPVFRAGWSRLSGKRKERVHTMS